MWMSVKQKKISNCIKLVLLLSGLGLYLPAIHEMQTAKGIGLYFCLKAGGTNRFYYDLAADGIRLLGLMWCVALSLVGGKWKSLGSLFRVTITMMALLPLFDESACIHTLFDTKTRDLWTLADWGETLLRIRALSGYMVLILPVFFLFCMMGKWKGEAWTREETIRFSIGVAATLLIDLFFVKMAPIAEFLLCFLLVSGICIKAERILAKDEKLEQASILFYLLLWLRVVYRMISI